MSRVILQPTGNKDAREHYEDTLVRPVDIMRIKPFVSKEEYNRLEDLYPSSLIPTWGVTAGVKNVNGNKWSKVKPADVTFFSANKVLYSHGCVTYKIHNQTLARHLWGVNLNDETWEYMYFLDEIKEHGISISLFNKIVGYSDNYKVQGFSVLDEEKSSALISYFNLKSETPIQPVNEEIYKEIVGNFDLDTLDVVGKTKLRAEQSFLRRVLFGHKAIAKCGFTQKNTPSHFSCSSH
ncbi:HNH endonuclease [Rossellomorea marisflavi]|uniref:HNH endonuclease n=1 Tax=Rossellomorea marisflavi TaxID=189381 RepID=UPI0039BF6256